MSFRLLVISGVFPPIKAPESAHTLYLCQHLARRHLDVHLLTTQCVRVAGEDIPANLTVHPKMPNWRWRQLPRLASLVRKLAPDAVLLIYIDWIYQCRSMITFAPTLIRNLLPPGTPFVTQFENESGLSGVHNRASLHTRLVRRMAARLAGGTGVNATYGTLLRDSTSIIALSERHIEAFERAQPGVRAKTALIPAPPIMRVCSANDGDARRRGRRKLAVSEEEIILIYFGFIYPSKGLETLLRAFGQIPVLDAGLRLVIVGDSLDAAYLEQSATARSANRRGGSDHLDRSLRTRG